MADVEDEQQQQLPLAAGQQQAVINGQPRYQVKLPDFWKEDAELWFSRVESVFRRAIIVDSLAKFDYVMEKLPNEILVSVRDIIRSMDDTTDNPYGLLKDRLLATLKPSAWSLVNRIIDFPELGGSRPSVMMAGMLSLLPEGEEAGMLFMALCLRRLPDHMREQLAAIKFNSPRDMAAHADVLWEARCTGTATGLVSAIRSRASSPAYKKKKQQERGGLCFFHHRFAERANRCQPPCSWTGNELAASDN